MYDRATVQGATFNMRGQLYRGHANATAFSSSPVVSALGSESDDPGSSPGWCKALCPWDVQKNALYVCFMHALCSGFYYAETKIPNFRLDRTLLSNLAFDLISGVQRAFSSNTSQAQYNRTLCDSSIFTNQSSPVVR